MVHADPLSQALADVGLRPGRAGAYFRMWCPFHPNPSGRTLWVSREGGRWGCFSARCARHSGGGLAELLVLRGLSAVVARSVVSSIDFSEAIRIARPTSLSDRDYAGAVTEAHVALWAVDWALALDCCRAADVAREAYVPGAPLSTWAESPASPGDVEHDCWEWLNYPLVHRRLSPGALELLDVGFDQALGVLTFPLRAPDGRVRGVARRECREKTDYVLDGCCWGREDERHRYVPVERGDTFFGWNQMLRRIQAGHPLVIVEGYADALRLIGYGYCAVAKMGHRMTRAQVALAASAPGQKVLWPDFGDLRGEGILGVREDASRLFAHGPVTVITDHAGLKDAGHAGMTEETAARCVASARSHFEWLNIAPNLLAMSAA